MTSITTSSVRAPLDALYAGHFDLYGGGKTGEKSQGQSPDELEHFQGFSNKFDNPFLANNAKLIIGDRGESAGGRLLFTSKMTACGISSEKQKIKKNDIACRSGSP